MALYKGSKNDSSEGFTFFLSSSTQYTLSLYDPFNNTIGSLAFTTNFGGIVTHIRKYSLAPDQGLALADGLSAQAAFIVGVEPPRGCQI